MRLFKKQKITDKDLGKVESAIKEIRECQNCKSLKEEMKECAERHKVKNNLKSVTSHFIRCPYCRDRVLLITQCKKSGHL